MSQASEQSLPIEPEHPGEEIRSLTRVRHLFLGGLRELVTPTEHRVPFLDFLRAAAILLVVNQHVTLTFTRQIAANAYTHFWPARNGWIGVDLFFVLSGYFIGGQLWKELKRSDTVSLKKFMIRRGLRIWPLYFFIFLVVFVATHGAPARQHGWTDLVFLTNYTNHGIVDGSWSLCTEEQFYLLTPLVLLLIGPRSLRSYRWGLGALLAVVVAVRIATYISLAGHFFVRDPEAFSKLYYPFHTHCDGLIAGLFLANLALERDRLRGLWTHPALLSLLALVVFVVLGRIQAETLSFLGLALLFGSLVWWGRTITAKFFDAHIFYLVSRLSFGMYLNHEYMEQWVVSHTAHWPLFGPHPALASAASFLVLAACSMAVSTCTFLLIEHPFLVLRTAVLRSKLASPLVAH